VPALKYLRGPFLDYVRDILNDPRARKRELFNPAYVTACCRPGRRAHAEGSLETLAGRRD